MYIWLVHHLKSQIGLTAPSLLVVAVVVGATFGVTFKQLKYDSSLSASARITSQLDQGTPGRYVSDSIHTIGNQVTGASNTVSTAPQAGPQATPTAKTTVNTVLPKTKTIVTPTPNPAKPNPIPPVSPPPTIDLEVGQMTFDGFKVPTIVFTIPVYTDYAGNVTVSVIEEADGSTLCSKTVAMSVDEDLDVTCTVNVTTPPLFVFGAATEDGTYARQVTRDYDGGL